MDPHCVQGPAQRWIPPDGRDRADIHATHTGAQSCRANGEPRNLGAPDVEHLPIQIWTDGQAMGGARDWKYWAGLEPMLPIAGGRTSTRGPSQGASSERLEIRSAGAASVRLRPQSSGSSSGRLGRSATLRRGGAGMEPLRLSIAGPVPRPRKEIRKWGPPRPARATVEHSWLGESLVAEAALKPCLGECAKPMLDATARRAPPAEQASSRVAARAARPILRLVRRQLAITSALQRHASIGSGRPRISPVNRAKPPRT